MFINAQGDSFATTFTSATPLKSTISEEKQHAIDETGILFTDDNFVISTIYDDNSLMLNHEQYSDFFEDCSFDGEYSNFNDNQYLVQKHKLLR